MLDCPIKQNLGMPCPGCGLQRSIYALLDGECMLSLKYYPATIPLALMFGYLLLHLTFKYEKGARNLVMFFIFNISLIYISLFLSCFGIWFVAK